MQHQVKIGNQAGPLLWLKFIRNIYCNIDPTSFGRIWLFAFAVDIQTGVVVSAFDATKPRDSRRFLATVPAPHLSSLHVVEFKGLESDMITLAQRSIH